MALKSMMPDKTNLWWDGHYSWMQYYISQRLIKNIVVIRLYFLRGYGFSSRSGDATISFDCHIVMYGHSRTWRCGVLIRPLVNWYSGFACTHRLWHLAQRSLVTQGNEVASTWRNVTATDWIMTWCFPSPPPSLSLSLSLALSFSFYPQAAEFLDC